MMIEGIIKTNAVAAIRELYGHEADPENIQVQKTRPDFPGDYTIVVFPFLRLSGRSPEATASDIGNYLTTKIDQIEGFNVVKGFLNLSIRDDYWVDFLQSSFLDEDFGFVKEKEGPPVVIEFSSPNTNKPLHLGHIRNNLLGWSVFRILEANGKEVARVNLVNDRGIHICKTMLAYQKWTPGSDPKSEGLKGDKFVGELYVRFEKANREKVRELVAAGFGEEEAYRSSPLIAEAMDLLQKWENGDPEVRALWKKMNDWVYEGFDKTYERLGISFDKIYHESDTYLLGKELVKEGLEKGVFFMKDDGSVWADLKEYNLDEKLLLRSDGTSVYITQDLGTAQLRFDDYHPGRLLYVVGNEQNYHFDVLKYLLRMLSRYWADDIVHVSYGMVELPQGRMKSREGTVVDADDLLEEMHQAARKMTMELGKMDGLDGEGADELFEMIGQGALKYFILKVDPKKNMMFNPEESIDFNGNTGPFIQYTHARIRSLLKKAREKGMDSRGMLSAGGDIRLGGKEKSVARLLHDFPLVVRDAGRELSPAIVANYAYDLAREYNQFYQEVPVLREDNPQLKVLRLMMSELVAEVIKKSMTLLGISVPERM